MFSDQSTRQLSASPPLSFKPHYVQYPRYFALQSHIVDTEERTDAHEDEVEEQMSYSGNPMASDPVTPALEGFPNVKVFDQLLERNWVKNSFMLSNNQTPKGKELICREGKPIVIQEKLFKVLTRAHQQCQHGGRDKTTAQARMTYSGIPAELVAQYIKICPTCRPILSEPPVLASKGFPEVVEFDKRMASYIKHLPDEFKDKATISWGIAGKIGKTLLGDTTEPVEFQDWSKQMFTLGLINGKRSVFRGGKPIAIQEKIFKILTIAHWKCGHEDQKTTSAEANKLYSCNKTTLRTSIIATSLNGFNVTSPQTLWQ
ncbi:hypothetical protein I7I51_01247 [Histoplasma capsulatum]|uniref:Integrase zinc-binding domain-containing protein n=1 Tax=Ajellomyces capsulatus TaxID=5037 RepID=A0A8A1MHY3_AJECA|nr:hypothetical protein I7I51_01247 [Histoplasma capsulatum]